MNAAVTPAAEYDVYHDESKEAGYWHGILLVPRRSRATILEHLATIRKETRFGPPLSFKGVKTYGDRFQCSRAWVQLGVYALMQDIKGRVEKVLITARGYDRHEKRQATEFREIIRVTEPLGMRFIVFRERDCFKFLDPAGDFLDYAAKVETTFRMGFKGGLHLLFGEDDPVAISSIHFDGYEHHRRHVDKDRIISRLVQGLRPYCKIADKPVVDDRPSDHREKDAQLADDCQFLQLADLLIGSFRTVLGDCKNDAQADVAHPVANLVEKWKRGPARMKKSRWHHGFCISQCYLQDGSWQFANLPAKEDAGQFNLGFFSECRFMPVANE
jgi:hypothetical protein